MIIKATCARCLFGRLTGVEEFSGGRICSQPSRAGKLVSEDHQCGEFTPVDKPHT